MQTEENRICAEFIKAVNNFDRDKIIEIADAVWFFKDFFKGGWDDSKFTLPDYLPLQMAKFYLKRDGKKATVRQVAQFLKGSDDVTSEDGFKSLRRKLQAMGFPLLERKRRTRKNHS